MSCRSVLHLGSAVDKIERAAPGFCCASSVCVSVIFFPFSAFICICLPNPGSPCDLAGERVPGAVGGSRVPANRAAGSDR